MRWGFPLPSLECFDFSVSSLVRMSFGWKNSWKAFRRWGKANVLWKLSVHRFPSPELDRRLCTVSVLCVMRKNIRNLMKTSFNDLTWCFSDMLALAAVFGCTNRSIICRKHWLKAQNLPFISENCEKVSLSSYEISNKRREIQREKVRRSECSATNG